MELANPQRHTCSTLATQQFFQFSRAFILAANLGKQLFAILHKHTFHFLPIKPVNILALK